jgi:hypothetical protein
MFGDANFVVGCNLFMAVANIFDAPQTVECLLGVRRDFFLEVWDPEIAAQVDSFSIREG